MSATPIHPHHHHTPPNWGHLPTKLLSVLRHPNHHHGGGGGGPGPEWDLDLNRISRRLNSEFFPQSEGPPPFVSIHLIHLILALGLIIGIIYLIFALVYYTMQKLRSLCPSVSFRRRRRRDVESGSPKELPTPEILEARRQERLSILQKECQNLENQLTAEKATSLTSRASDSDLEYLGYADEDTPPLKRNSISLQDIPQSVVKIRREKQLRQLKEEIELLHALSQSQDLDKEPLSSRSPLLRDLRFVFPTSRSKSHSPSPVDTSPVIVTAEHLSQRISHLKAQRRLQVIRSDLEGLALHLVHSDEIRAKTSSLQDIPKTALGAKRQKELLTIAKEIEHVKNYKLQQKTILSTVLADPATPQKTDEVLAKLNREQQAKGISSYRSPPTIKKVKESTAPLQRQISTADSVASADNSCSTSLQASASIKRTRAQELNRVRVELKELSYKLNLNYVFDEGDREKMFPADWPKQCSFSKDQFK